MAFVPPAISGYNINAPSDDGAVTPSNRSSWSTIKTKLGDPLYNWIEDVIDAIEAAEGLLDDSLVITSTAATAAAQPTIQLIRSSATPANDDLLGQILFQANNSALSPVEIANIVAKWIDVTSTSEDVQLLIQTMIAGSLATRMLIGAGLAVGTSTDPGAGLVNALNGYQRNAVALPYQVRASALLQPLGAASAAITFPHGLATAPARDALSVRYKCIADEHGYLAADPYPYAEVFTFANAGGNIYGLVLEEIDATNVVYRVGDAGALVMNKTTKSAGTPTIAKWNLELTILHA